MKYFNDKSSLYQLDKLLVFENSLGKFLHENNTQISKLSSTPNEMINIFKENFTADLKEKILSLMSNSDKRIKEKIETFEILCRKNGIISNNEGIKEILNKEGFFQIEKINNIDSMNSRHALFCVSGFMSEDDDGKESWGKIVNYFSKSQIFYIKYASTTTKQFYNSIKMDQVGSNLMKQVFGTFLHKKKESGGILKGFFKKFSEKQEDATNENGETYKTKLQNIMADFPKTSFDQAKINADIAGALLALIISIGLPCQVETVSIISFSLGTQLVNECLCYLRELEVYDKIHDIIFCGGAAQIDTKCIRNINSFQVVNGKIFNVYSRKDWALFVLYKLLPTFQPIGRYNFQITTDQTSESSNFYTAKIFQNLECELAHLEYREKFQFLMEALFQIFQENIEKVNPIKLIIPLDLIEPLKSGDIPLLYLP